MRKDGEVDARYSGLLNCFTIKKKRERERHTHTFTCFFSKLYWKSGLWVETSGTRLMSIHIFYVVLCYSLSSCIYLMFSLFSHLMVFHIFYILFLH